MKPSRILVESPSFTFVRWTTATLAIAAGVIHLAQIGPHNDEDPLFGIFFLVVGVLQLAGGAYLLYPFGAKRLRLAVAWFGVAGSLATIAIWAISRTLGLPFGAEPGAAETVGLADAAADLFELFTALLLGMWIVRARLRQVGVTALTLSGVAAALALAALWLSTRALGWFDPDPRLVAFSELADAAAVGFLVVLATLLLRVLVVALRAVPAARAPSSALLATLVLAELSLVAFTLPAGGGQNRDCLYAPIREDSGLSHAKPVEPVRLAVGETRSVVVLLLVACADVPVTITKVEPIEPIGDTVVVEGITIDRTRSARSERVRADAGGGVRAVGAVVEPGQGRYPIVVQVRGARRGAQALSAFIVGWAANGASDSLGFASSTYFCVGDGECPPPVGH